MTFTLAAVFAPIAFTEGRTGKLFAEFALTLASAVIVSGFCALTLSPMMSSRLKCAIFSCRMKSCSNKGPRAPTLWVSSL